MPRLRTTAPACAAFVLLLLGGCAGEPARKLLDQIPLPPRDAAAAATRCGDHPDYTLAEVSAQLTMLQKQEETHFLEISAAAQAASDAGTGYEQRHPQAAKALKARDAAIGHAARELSVRMDQSAAAALQTLAVALVAIDGGEGPKLAQCVLVQQDSRWLPEPGCATPVRAAAKSARDAAVDRYLYSAQQVWQGWREDAERTTQDWTKLPDGIPETDDPYVQRALAGYRHSQEEVLRQLMQASTNLCSVAARAVAHTDPTN